MSVMDDAQALRGIAGEIPIPEIRRIQQNLLELDARIVGILGPNLTKEDPISQRAAKAGAQVVVALAALQEYQSSIFLLADALEQAGS